MPRQRRNFSGKFKSDLVIELLNGKKDFNTLAAKNNTPSNLLRIYSIRGVHHLSELMGPHANSCITIYHRADKHAQKINLSSNLILNFLLFNFLLSTDYLINFSDHSLNNITSWIQCLIQTFFKAPIFLFSQIFIKLFSHRMRLYSAGEWNVSSRSNF